MVINQVPSQIQNVADGMLRKLLDSGLQSGYLDQNQAAFIYNEWSNNSYGVLNETLKIYPANTLNEAQLFNVVDKFAQKARSLYFANNNNNGGYFNNGGWGNNNGGFFNNRNAGGWGPRWNGNNNNGFVNHSVNPRQSFFTNQTSGYEQNNSSPYASTSSVAPEKKQEEPIMTNTQTLEEQVASAPVVEPYNKPIIRHDIDKVEYKYGHYDLTSTVIENHNHDDITYVEGTVDCGYKNGYEAIMDVNNILDITTSHKFVNIKYNQLFICNAPVAEVNEMINGLKEITNTVSGKNKIAYIESIRKHLDKFNRGIADTVEQIFVNEFNKRTAAGEAASSDEMTPNEYSFSVNSLKEITEYISSSDKPEIRQRQSIQGFKEKVTEIAKNAILGTINNMEICNPQVDSDLTDIIKVCRGVTITDADGHDVPLYAINDLKVELKTATAAAKKTADFANKTELVGKMYEVCNNFSVIRLKNRQVCFTTLSFLGFVANTDYVKYCTICIGGEPDDDISYIIQSKVMSDSGAMTELLIQPTPNSFVGYVGVITTDNWIRFSPHRIM